MSWIIHWFAEYVTFLVLWDTSLSETQVDSENNELVVGIVGQSIEICSRSMNLTEWIKDYIRTYTWDKKLESWVKESAFLGGAGKGEPTIVTPKQYRQRFLGAMERYFPLVSLTLSIFLIFSLTCFIVKGTGSLGETDGYTGGRFYRALWIVAGLVVLSIPIHSTCLCFIPYSTVQD